MEKFIMKMRGLFVVCYLVGCLLAFGGVLLSWTWLIIVGPLCCMVAYFLVGLWLVDEGSKSSFADTLYFLGFLFTLSSLGITLLASSPDDDRFQFILSTFALALVTTVAGLFFRVLLTGFEPEATLDQEDVESTMDESWRRVRLQLERLHNQLQALQDLVADTTQRSVDNAATQLAEGVANARQEMENGSRIFSDQLKQEASRIGEVWTAALTRLDERAARALDPLEQRMAGAAEELGASVDGISATLRKLDRASELEQRFDEVAQALSRATASSRELATVLSESGGSEHWAAMLEGVDDVTTRLESLAAVSRSAESGLQARLGSDGSVTAALDRALATATAGHDSIQEAGMQAREDVRRFRESLTRATETLRTEADRGA